MMGPTAVLVAFTIVMGIWAQPFLGIASRAAETLMQPSEYIRVVMSAGSIQRQQAAAVPDRGHLAWLRLEAR